MGKIIKSEELILADNFVNRPDLLLPDRPIAFNRDFVALGIGVKGALFLSQALYWDKRVTLKDGWFWKTTEEWEEETGLTIKEQRKVRDILIEKGYIEVELRGLPAKNHFCVDTYKIVSDLMKTKIGENKICPKGKTRVAQTANHSITESTYREERAKQSFANESPEIHNYLGFPLPEEWQDDSYYESEGTFVPRFLDSFSRPVKQADITKKRKDYQAHINGKKSAIKREETMSPEVRSMVELLKTEQGITKLDGTENYKHANSVKIAFLGHLVKDMGLSSSEAEESIVEQFDHFLDRVRNRSEFHWNNLTSMGYLNRNFNKILREIK